MIQKHAIENMCCWLVPFKNTGGAGDTHGTDTSGITQTIHDLPGSDRCARARARAVCEPCRVCGSPLCVSTFLTDSKTHPGEPVSLCDPCIPCVPFVSRLPPVSMIR